MFANLLKHLKILNCSCKYMINLKKELTTDGQLENTQNLVECLQKFNDKLQEVRNYLIEVKELNPKKDHLLLTERVEEEIKPSNNFIQKLTIIGVALTPVLGFCFYKLMKR